MAADSDSGYKWWIRYVLVPLIGGGGIVALTVAYMNRPTPPTSQEPQTNALADQQTVTADVPVPGPAQESVRPGSSASNVEALAARWLAAFLAGDADEVVALSGEPFFFDRNLVLTKTLLRRRYQALAAAKQEAWSQAEVRAIKVQTVGELQDSGYDLTSDRAFRSMNLSRDDFAVSVTFEVQNRTEGMLIVVRQKGARYEIAGMWD